MPLSIRYPIRRLFVGGGPRFDGAAIAAPIVELLAALTERSWELRNERVDSVKTPEDIGQPWILHRLRWRLRSGHGRQLAKASLEVLLAESALNMSFQDYDIYRVTLALADARSVLVEGSIGPRPDLLRAEGFDDDELRRACEAAGVAVS